ncbi:MAG: acyltransferase domain-containing protein [Myxococcales bacterium]|nr:acyltransferase domain-containing protein [Myxococcales bacterium]
MRPHAVVGHSVGAYAAAVVAGALELDDALRLVAACGELMDGLRSAGRWRASPPTSAGCSPRPRRVVGCRGGQRA